MVRETGIDAPDGDEPEVVEVEPQPVNKRAIMAATKRRG
jgi:hypothetical protein